MQACLHVKSQLNSVDTDLIIVFASPGYVAPEVQEVIARILKPKHLVGSSTGGIILSTGMTNRGIAITGINSEEIRFGASAINAIDNEDMHLTGFELARKASQDLNMSHREAFIIFSEGIEKNNSPFIRGIKETLGGGFPLLGAIS